MHKLRKTYASTETQLSSFGKQAQPFVTGMDEVRWHISRTPDPNDLPLAYFANDPPASITRQR